tara:strand:- start:71 stop:358 length:288 start_codon:yes stop_codon:yes gene_type:complete
MAITKDLVAEKIEVVGTWNVQVAIDTVIKEDGKEISRSRHRHVLQPCTSSKDGDTWTHTDTDISAEDDTVKAVCNAVWSTDIVANYKTFVENQEV